MRNEFEFSDFAFINDINVNNRLSSEEINALQESYDTKASDFVIKISGMTDEEDSVAYTYAKFLEILDTFGLEGLIEA